MAEHAKVVSSTRNISTSTTFSASSGSGQSDESDDSGYRSEVDMKLPDKLESPETLQWLGFNETRAGELFLNWTNWHPDDPTDFTALALDYIRYFRSDADNDDDEHWNGVLSQMGLSHTLIDAVMDPAYHRVRLTQSAKYWVIDTFEAKYRVLSKALESSQQRARLGNLERISKHGPRKENAVDNKNQANKPHPRLSYSTAYPEYTPGSVTLWIGHDKLRFEPAFPSSGEVRLDKMSSQAPSGFAGFPALMLYTAVDREVAKIYASYAKRRIGASGTMCVLAIHVPDAFIQSLDPYLLYFGERWKEVVWTCRKGDRLAGNLAAINSKKLIIGHICSKANTAIARKPSWKDLKEEDIMKILRFGEVVKAVQYFFKGEDVIDSLSNPAAGVRFELCTVGEMAAKDIL